MAEKKLKDPHASKGKKKELDPRQAAQARKRFEWLVTFLIVNFRFVHQILGMMTKIPDPSLGTMGVRVLPGGKFELRYDPEFVESLSDSAATYVFAHEVYHLALHHCTTRRFDNHIIGNVAHDLAVNELIPVLPGECEPPKDKDGNLIGCFVSELKKDKDFSDILERQTAEWYYDYLYQKIKQDGGGKGKGEGSGEGEGDGQGEGQGDGKSKDDPKDGKGGGSLLDRLKAISEIMDNHGGWKEDEISDEKVRAKISEIDKMGGNSWGSVPLGAQEAIRAAQIRRVNWRSLIRRHIGNRVWKDRASTRKRPNRRTGLIHPGTKRQHVDKHLVAVDTSGSIDSELLSMFLTAINQLTDHCPIDIMQFDCSKQVGPEPFDRKKVDYTFTGRGGTDFVPVIEESDKGRYKSLVIFTDGCAPAPPRPKTAAVLWVMRPGDNAPVEWGKKVVMSKH